MLGTATTSNALYTGLALLIVHPEYQKKAQELIDKAIGKKPPELADKAKLPYIESMIFEILRYSTISQPLPHQTMEDTTLCGYNIPGGTEVTFCYYFFLH